MTRGLAAGEHIKLNRLAAIAQGRMTKGGRLLVTNQRVLFQPRALDKLFGARELSVPRASVVSVDVAPRTRGLLNGGLRRRLVIRLHDGTEHLFVVNRVEPLVSTLRQELL